MGQIVNASVQRSSYFFTEPHCDFDLLALAEGNDDDGKINVLEIGHFISGYRELDLV